MASQNSGTLSCVQRCLIRKDRLLVCELGAALFQMLLTATFGAFSPAPLTWHGLLLLLLAPLKLAGAVQVRTAWSFSFLGLTACLSLGCAQGSYVRVLRGSSRELPVHPPTSLPAQRTGVSPLKRLFSCQPAGGTETAPWQPCLSTAAWW